MLKKSFIICTLILLIVSISSADVPQLINYQGWLTDGNGDPLNATVSILFTIYDSETLGNVKWSETHQTVTVIDGIFDVLLGSVTSIPYSVFDGSDRYLALKVGNDSEMVPRKRLVSVGYSFRAYNSDKLDGKDDSTFVQSVDGISPDGSGNVDLVAGANVTITPDSNNNQITISTTGGGAGNGHSLDAADGDPADVLFIDNDGNVGVGTTDPTDALDVKGNIHSSGKIISGNSITINGDSTGGSGPDQITASTGSLAILGDPDITDIKVGIGTETPGANLEVITGPLSNSAIKGHGGQYGVYGVSGVYGGNGVYGKGGSNYGYLGGLIGGVFGSDDNGIQGYLGGTYGAHGINGNSGNYGYLGSHAYGTYGKNSNGNTGYLGGNIYSAYGKNSNGNIGYLGGSEYGAYAINSGGNNGYLGSEYFGAYGAHNNGNYGYLGGMYSAVYGEGVIGVIAVSNSVGAAIIARNTSTGDLFQGKNASSGSPVFKVSNDGTMTTKVLEITGGGDLAEPFDITGSETITSGMVVAIDAAHPGQLRIADKAYDRTVAGCVSGANGISPGLIMQQEGTVADGLLPVSLSGRIYCCVDASYGAIQPGDLLTTSDTPGHAMKVTDYTRAQGAILGKAMTSLQQGRGLVLVLVTLQ